MTISLRKTRRVKALKAQLKRRGVDSSACVEKRELVALLKQAVLSAHAATGSAARGGSDADAGAEANAGEFLVCHHTPTYQCSLT